MSQAGLIDIEGSHPQIPTEFITDDGTAIPISNQLELLAAVVPNAGIPFESVGSGNTVTYQIQYSDESVVSDPTLAGISSFDSSAFDVDANGFVTLLGGGVAATNIDVDASTAPGTDPVVPNGSGNITITGGQVAAGTIGANVLRTNSLAANSLTVEIQRASSGASPNNALNGVSHFNSTEFSVDGSGFVSLIGGTAAIDSIGVQTGTNPIVPDGAGLVTINGAVVAAGTNPVRTDGTGANTMAVEVQITQALAATDATKIGLANFDSAAFDVDANGFVQLNGGGIAATSFEVQANTGPGTDPVVPSATGVVTVNGAAVANHSVVLESHSRAANAYNLEIQYAAAAAATDATKSGVAHFDSASFAVDANGFVTLAGGGLAIDSIGVDATSGGGTNPVLPTVAGLVTVNGALVAAGTNPIRSVSTAANVYQIQVQTAQALAATDATKVGLANFDSTDFSVDANGFVTLNGAGAGQTITGDTGGALSPTAGNWNLLGSGSITTAGAGSTLTTQLTGLTNHAVLVGAGTTTITKLAVGTDGQVLVGSTGADPVFATLGAGTGISYTPGPGSLTISATNIVAVTTPGAYPYTTLAADYLILVDTSSARTINLQGSPTTGKILVIKDNVGSAATNNITISPAAGNIDGSASQTINIAYGSVTLIYQGTQWVLV